MRRGFTSLDTLQPASVVIAKQTIASDLARKFIILPLRFRELAS
jgi:hypothetical protein